MSIEVVTKDDLQAFKAELLSDIKMLLQGGVHQPGRMLKSYQVKELLNISTGTLHKLRQNGTIPYVRIDGLFLYNEDDVRTLLKGQLHRRL